MLIFHKNHKQKSQTIALMLILSVMSLWLSACNKAVQGADAVAKPVQFTTVATEGNMLAFDTSALQTQSGAKIELTFKNNSTVLQHNWVLANGGETVADHVYKEALAAGEKNSFMPDNAADLLVHTNFVDAGEQDTISFTAPATPGDYTFLCTYPGHFLAGMKGTLTVSAP